MSSDVIAIQTAKDAGRPWVQTLHEWVTTVDHKRLGVLYILYALFFLRRYSTACSPCTVRP